MSNRYKIGDYTYCLKCEKQLSLFDYMPVKIENARIKLPFFCVKCQYELPYIHYVFCEKCNAYKACYDNCEQHIELKQNFSCIAYNDEVKQWVKMFKFEGAIKIGEALAPLLEIAIKRFIMASNQEQFTNKLLIRGLLAYSDYNKNCNIVTSVPISRQRLIERGFNQAEYLANSVAKRLNCLEIPLLNTANSFAHSSHMSKLEREETVQQKFHINERMLHKLINYQVTSRIRRLNIIIVDDIYTTGYTLRACARIIKEHLGDSCHIYGITLARA